MILIFFLRKKFKFIFLFFVTFLFSIFSLTLFLNSPKVSKYSEFRSSDFLKVFGFDENGTFPYVSGASLLLSSDFIYDVTLNNIKVDRIKDGNVIFLKTDYMEDFFNNIYPKMRSKIILITQNSDNSTDIAFSKYLNDDKLIAWLGQNPGFVHPKHIPIPIGLENPNYGPHKIKYIRTLNINSLIKWEKRKYLIYINFSPDTNPIRKNLENKLFKKFNNILISKKVDYFTYLKHIENSKFVLCPRGNGLDTHRFYESILMGAIPIVENSTLFPIYLKSTTLVVPSFENLTLNMLENPQNYINDMSFSRKILLMSTWSNMIDSLKRNNLR